ncbi:hypothetical protein AVEN_204813-1 [Araneus ventricosus]|uniref:Uncharacterized protein n=1 Tax=Araneus ventricosus TaxID=182803 RepID=A0A4Y2K2J9_ARAVE|nr:hypothetical protein AVEN_204813-1 [Araneus ventricosus]
MPQESRAQITIKKLAAHPKHNLATPIEFAPRKIDEKKDRTLNFIRMLPPEKETTKCDHEFSRFKFAKRLQNIADNADRKAHNLYLNHTQATPNAEYVDYEDEETDCSSDISEVILNLNICKPLYIISLTDPKYKQLTLFVAKSSQMRLGLPSTAVVGDRFGVSDRAVAAIAQVFFTMLVS